MPLPIINFGYTRNGLTIAFINLSLNLSLTSTYNWNFGDGNSSNLENPSHTYNEEGAYQVTLEVTNETGSASDMVLLNLTPQPIPTIMTDIPKMVDLYSPSSIVGLIKNHEQKEFLIAKWQNYIQPLVDIPNEVSVENMYNPVAYPPLVNSLIAKLVVIDIIEMDSAAFFLNLLNKGAGTTTTSGEESSKGGIKSIETGPTKVERYENKDASSMSEMMDNLGKAYASLTKPNGILEQMKASVCQESQRVDIYLPMCGPLTIPVIPIQVGKLHRSAHNANPFGVTQRML